jgi:hypothetical protein
METQKLLLMAADADAMTRKVSAALEDSGRDDCGGSVVGALPGN